MGSPPLTPRGTSNWMSTPRNTNNSTSSSGTNNSTSSGGTNNSVAPGGSPSGLGGHRQVTQLSNNVRAPAGGLTTPRQRRLSTTTSNDTSTVQLMPHVQRPRAAARSVVELKPDLNRLTLKRMKGTKVKGVEFKKQVEKYKEEGLSPLQCAKKATEKYKNEMSNCWARLTRSDDSGGSESKTITAKIKALNEKYIEKMETYLSSASGEQEKTEIRRLMKTALES